MPSTLFRRRLSHADLPASEKFEAFQQHMAPLFTIEHASNGAVGGDTTGDAYLVNDLWFYDVGFPPARYLRSADRVRRDNVDFIVINAFRRGEWRGVVNGESVERKNQPLQILDCSREQYYETGVADYCGIALRRQAMEDRLGDLRQIEDFPTAGPRADLLHDYLRLLGRRLSQQPAAAGELERATYDLVAACLQPSPDHFEQARPILESSTLSRAQRYVGFHLADETLSPEKISREIGLSRRTLYRLFEPLGGVARYIHDARLERIHNELRGTNSSEPIASIAARYGFENKEVFWRAFKRRFGMTPGEVRHEAPRRATDALSAKPFEPDSMQAWIDHLCR